MRTSRRLLTARVGKCEGGGEGNQAPEPLLNSCSILLKCRAFASRGLQERIQVPAFHHIQPRFENSSALRIALTIKNRRLSGEQTVCLHT
jgi:hypothetical protein